MNVRHAVRAVWADNLKEWKVEISYPLDFARTFFDPILWLLPYLLFGVAIAGGRSSPHLRNFVGSGDVVRFIILGYVLMAFLGTAIYAMGMSLRREQLYGTLESVFTCPVPRWVIVFGMAFHSTIHQGLIVLVQILLFWMIFGLGLDVSGLLPALLSVGLMLIPLYGIGMVVAASTLVFKEGWVITEVLYAAMTVLSPVVYPLAVLPTMLQKVSATLPTTYGVLMIRHFLSGETMPWSGLEAGLRLAGLGCLWVILGTACFVWVERRMRATGGLAHH